MQTGLITILLHLLKWDIFQAGFIPVKFSHYMFLLEQKHVQKKSNQRLCIISLVKYRVFNIFSIGKDVVSFVSAQLFRVEYSLFTDV